MAWSLSRLYLFKPRSQLLAILSKTFPQFYSKFEDVDVIDDFTSHLLQRKIEIWDIKKRKSLKLLKNSTIGETKLFTKAQIDSLKPGQIGVLFQDALQNDDGECILKLIRICVELGKAPPLTILLNILSFSAQTGDKEIVNQLCDLCKLHYPEITQQNSNFTHFIAETIWVRGDISKALELFEETYRSNAYLRRRIRLILKYLINDLVRNKSEAALRNIINFSERILKDFQDFYPLTCVWQACFLSEWFTDQCIALELLEKHPGLGKFVVNRISYVVFVSLKCHRTEVVYRLVEILLKYKLRAECSHILGTLLEYQFNRGDFLSCSEIIRWAVDTNLALPRFHRVKLINILLNEKMKTPLASLQPELQEKPKTNFKF